MERMATAVPIKPGKTEALRRYVDELLGPRAEDDAAFQRKYGIRRQTVWLQQLGDRDVAIVYQEADDLERAREAREEIGRSDDPHLAWKLANYRDVYELGPDPEGPPVPELLADRTF